MMQIWVQHSLKRGSACCLRATGSVQQERHLRGIYSLQDRGSCFIFTNTRLPDSLLTISWGIVCSERLSLAVFTSLRRRGFEMTGVTVKRYRGTASRNRHIFQLRTLRGSWYRRQLNDEQRTHLMLASVHIM